MFIPGHTTGICDQRFTSNEINSKAVWNGELLPTVLGRQWLRRIGWLWDLSPQSGEAEGENDEGDRSHAAIVAYSQHDDKHFAANLAWRFD